MRIKVTFKRKQDCSRVDSALRSNSKSIKIIQRIKLAKGQKVQLSRVRGNWEWDKEAKKSFLPYWFAIFFFSKITLLAGVFEWYPGLALEIKIDALDPNPGGIGTLVSIQNCPQGLENWQHFGQLLPTWPIRWALSQNPGIANTGISLAGIFGFK